ncbi:MAG TPA: hypothetical protein VK586_24230 [Streptosporangiaceae bacterium]|nr:hypothetical protein [Streptosporangiaceae bacterium]
MSQHEDAVRDATRRYRRTEAAHDQARDDVIAAMLKALEAGERPTDVTSWSPFTAAYVRKLARSHGIEAPSR